MITQAELIGLLDYDKETGIFLWKKSYGRAVAGARAGTVCNGYVTIGLLGYRYMAHRLAWLFVYGITPEDEIDHINGIKSDNRISNLRSVTHSQNLQNRRHSSRNSKSGVLGVAWNASCKKWYSAIRKGGKGFHLGSFETVEEAYAAYVAAKRNIHEFGML